MTQTDKQRPGAAEGRSEAAARRTTGVLMAVTMLALWYLQGWPLRIGLVAVLFVALHEMYAAFKHRGARPVRWVGFAYAALAMPAYLLYGTVGPLLLTALMMMVGVTCVVLRGEADFEALVATLLPLIYPGMLTALMFPVQDIEPTLTATVALGLCFLLAVANDLTAYEVGIRLGKTPLCPALSPKKTVEGAVAGIAGSVLIALTLPPVADWVARALPQAQAYWAPLPPLWHFALLGLLGGVAAPVGDLTASLIKRHCGVKDYGSIFPGHGGMLDRVDSVIFTGAVTSLYFALVLGGY